MLLRRIGGLTAAFVCLAIAGTDALAQTPNAVVVDRQAMTATRGRVSGNDWMQPMLWQRYHGFFSPYLQRRIDAIRAAAAVASATSRRRRKSVVPSPPLLYTAAS